MPLDPLQQSLIESDLRNTTLSLRAIAKKHQTTHTTVHNLSKKQKRISKIAPNHKELERALSKISLSEEAKAKKVIRKYLILWNKRSKKDYMDELKADKKEFLKPRGPHELQIKPWDPEETAQERKKLIIPKPLLQPIPHKPV